MNITLILFRKKKLEVNDTESLNIMVIMLGYLRTRN